LRTFPRAPGGRDKRFLAVGADGTVLAGATDGSVVALDARGRPRFQLGLRGAVKDVEARPDGDFKVTTSAGVVTVSADGAVREEPTPAATSFTLAYRARPAKDPLLEGIHLLSWAALARDDVWALGERWVEPRWHYYLRHFDGTAWRDVPMPDANLDGILVGPDHRANHETFVPNTLVAGAGGQVIMLGMGLILWPLGNALGSMRLVVFEGDVRGFRRLREVTPPIPKGSEGSPYAERPESGVYARGPAGRQVFCLADLCAARGPTTTAKSSWRLFGWLSEEPIDAARPIVFAGETLWRFDAKGLTRDGEVMRPMQGGRHRALWATGKDDVWAVTADSPVLVHWDGKAFQDTPSPVREPEEVWASGRSDVWVAGDGVAHFDGASWRRIVGVRHGPLRASGKDDVWIGRWHITPEPNARPDLVGETGPAPRASAPSRPLAVGPSDPAVRLERLVIDVAGSTPLKAALGVAAAPSGVVWLHDARRVIELDGTQARVLYETRAEEPIACQRCLAPSAAGAGAMLARGLGDVMALRSFTAGRVAGDIVWLPSLLAVARAPSGALWAVSGIDDENEGPAAVVSNASELRFVRGVPSGTYADVAVRADSDVWLSGGLASSRDPARAWPEGEGTLVHFDGRRFIRHRAPDGALHAVAAVAPSEAWAVGADGGLVHVKGFGERSVPIEKGDVVDAFHLELDGAPWRVTLRAVAATGPDDVWFAGDRSTLLHWDGKALHRVATTGIDSDGAFSAVVAPSAGRGWVVGPTGIWRIVR
jgi:hypothetical protein